MSVEEGSCTATTRSRRTIVLSRLSKPPLRLEVECLTVLADVQDVGLRLRLPQPHVLRRPRDALDYARDRVRFRGSQRNSVDIYRAQYPHDLTDTYILDTILKLDLFGVGCVESTVHNWLDKTEVQPASGANTVAPLSRSP